MDNPAVTEPAISRLRFQRSLESGERNEHDGGDQIRCQPGGHHRNGAGTVHTAPNTNVQEAESKDTIRRPSKNERGWRRIVRNFSPSWFSVTMGTGIVSTILITIPWQAPWLYYLSIVVFALNVCLFLAALTASVLRYTIWPEIWVVMIQDPVNSLFLGTMPMGFATIVEMWVFVCVPAWGDWAAYVAWGFWMADAAVAVAVTVSLGILLMSASHQRSLDSITAAQLLPIATTIVAAGTGSEVAAILPRPHHALGTVIACYVLWGMAVPMAFAVLVVYFHRLALFKMPPREVIVSAFLPLGPLGFGGYTILSLGRVAVRVFPETHAIDPLAGRVAYVAGFFVALVMWGFGLVWLAFALASIYQARPFPFNMGWWGFTFPLGVYSVSTILIGEELPSLFFRVLGTVFAVAVILLWIAVSLGTARGAWTGKLFNAPCLANLKKEHEHPTLLAAAGSNDEEEKQIESWRPEQMRSDGVAHRPPAAGETGSTSQPG